MEKTDERVCINFLCSFNKRTGFCHMTKEQGFRKDGFCKKVDELFVKLRRSEE